MATPARQFARAATRASALRGPGAAVLARAGRRFHSSQGGAPPPPPKSSGARWAWLAGLGAAAAAGGGALLYAQNGKQAGGAFTPRLADYQAVYDEIAGRLEEDEDYDDGSYGPVLLRLAWHCSGTYDRETRTGGSNGATMRFAPEAGHAANAGLEAARAFLKPVKVKFPWISYSDLWILGGVCAVQEMLGPDVPYRPGRSDGDLAACTPDGRLPNGAKGPAHVREIFNRMGLDDREMTALIGAHAVGRCHANRSGFDGPWTFSPTVITNDFYRLLLESKWQWKKWGGPRQYEDRETQSLMMLPADMALVEDGKFKELVKEYAADSDLWFKDFSAALVKLFELGVPFAEGTEAQRWVFKRLDG